MFLNEWLEAERLGPIEFQDTPERHESRDYSAAYGGRTSASGNGNGNGGARSRRVYRDPNKSVPAARERARKMLALDEAEIPAKTEENAQQANLATAVQQQLF